MKDCRKFIVLPLVIMAMLLAFASMAWACTVTQGQTVVNPPAGGRNSQVTGTAYGAIGAKNMYLWFLQGADICMNHSATQISQSSVDASGAGTLGPLNGTIPPGAKTGPAQICFADTGHNYATVSAVFTVL